jgi:signal recognition particle receptor subunit alpha
MLTLQVDGLAQWCKWHPCLRIESVTVHGSCAGVDQLVKFNQRLADLSPPGKEQRLIDGVLVTKFDAIDNKVGAVLSMAYSSGAPIMFVGCGQTYVDLMRLDVLSIVKSLLQ